ncbi:MAG: DNA translocase FtsK 4TM domain-containing protein, partial [Clostridia bacterium]
MAASKKKSPAKKNPGKKSTKSTAKKSGVGQRLSPAGVAVILSICAVLLFLLFICIPPRGNIGGAGILLQYIVKIFASLLGLARFVLPFYLLLLAYAFFRKKNPEFRFPRYLIFSTLLFVVFPTFFCIDQNLVSFGDFMKTAAGGEGGGVFGGLFAYGMLLLLTEPVSVVLLVILGVFSVLMLTNFSWKAYLSRKKEELSEKRAAKKEANELAAMETRQEEDDEN